MSHRFLGSQQRQIDQSVCWFDATFGGGWTQQRFVESWREEASCASAPALGALCFADTTQARVASAQVRYGDKAQPYTVYCIDVSVGALSYQTFRRFKEFVWLDERLKAMFAEQPIPSLPPKS